MNRSVPSRLLCLAALALLVAADALALDGPSRADSSAGTIGPPTPAQKVLRKPAAPAAPKAAPAAPRVTSLDVTVTDPAGRPVEGAFVMAVPTTGGQNQWGLLASGKVRSTLAGRDGRARLDALPPGPWNVSIHARGFVAQPLRRIASGPLAVRLERGGAISGTVRAADGARPIAGARVGLVSGVPLPEAWQNEATRIESTSDAQGRFRIEGIGRSPVRVVARAPGFGRAERSDVRAGESVELFLFPGATLSGTVRDEAGQPVAGAQVRAESDAVRSLPQTESTDGQGAFTMAGITPAEYVVFARGGTRAPGFAVVLVEPEAEASASLVLSEGGYATGRVVDSEGRPLAGRVKLEVFEDHGLPASASDAVSAEAKADGRFVLGPLPQGTLGLAVSASRHASRRVEASVPGPGRSVDLGDVTLESGQVIRGRVRDREGAGVAGAQVRASGQGSGERSEGEAVAEDDGAFVVGGLRSGRHEVVASASGYATARGKAVAGGEPVVLVMEQGGEITGRVVDAQGAPVEDAQVEAQPTEQQPFGMRRGSERSDDGEGRFAIRDLSSGSYVLQARASGRGEVSLPGVRVAPGRTTNVGTLALGAGGAVQGTVVDADGQGIPGATVSIERELNMRTGALSSQTGSNGAFEVRGVPAGKVNVLAQHPAFAAGRPAIAEVDPEKEPVPVRIVLVRGGRLEGRALRRDGSPFTGGRVTWSSLEPGAVMSWNQAPIAADGSFVADHLVPGRAAVNLMAFTPTSPMASGANIVSGIDKREVEVREGETATVSFSLRDVVVAGRVTRSGQPAAGIHVSLSGGAQGSSVMAWSGPASGRAVVPPSGPPPLNATTREDGGFELLAFAPGRAQISMSAAATGQRFPGREVELPDAERYEVELEIADTSVAGVVLDRESGQPLADAQVGLRQGGPKGKWKGGAESGPDGRFTIAVEAGDYELSVRAPGHRPSSVAVSVGSAGPTELRVELERGQAVAGRVVDEAGRPMSGTQVVATSPERTWMGSVITLADGSFSMDGLDARPHAFAAGSPLAGFAVRTGVTPGNEPLTLTLRPGGKIAARVLGPDGRPATDVFPHVHAWAGVPVSLPGMTSARTNANGACELDAPAGAVEVQIGFDKAYGTAGVTVRPGETVPLEIALKEIPPR